MVADKITEEGTTGDDMVTDSHDDPVTISSFVVKECVSGGGSCNKTVSLLSFLARRQTVAGGSVWGAQYKHIS